MPGEQLCVAEEAWGKRARDGGQDAAEEGVQAAYYQGRARTGSQILTSVWATHPKPLQLGTTCPFTACPTWQHPCL